jgi:Tol biopolymer transport system component
VGSQKAQLTWLDRGGRKLGAVGDPQHLWAFFRLSPDGRKVAADVFDISTGNTDIWFYEVSTGAAERVTFEPGGEYQPVWSPDGTRLAFGSAQIRTPQLRMKSVTDHGAGESFPADGFQMPSDWTPDGRWIVYGEFGNAHAEIWAASVAQRQVMPLLQTQFDNMNPAISPTQDYLAFSTNETGRPEVYAQRLETGDSPKLSGERMQVSHEGGRIPRWSRDGKELFFLSPDDRIMATAVRPGAVFGPPTPLFRLPLSSPSMSPNSDLYDVSPDGQRFLVPIREAAGVPLQVVVNWQAEQAELKR